MEGQWKCITNEACDGCLVREALDAGEGSEFSPTSIARLALVMPMFEELLANLDPMTVGTPGNMSEANVEFMSRLLEEKKRLLGPVLLNAIYQVQENDACGQAATL